MNLRQLANLLLAIAQPAVGAVVFASDIPFERTFGNGGSRPLLEPAGYAFAIWSVIYAGTIAYGVLQALPSRRDDPLFARIGWWTAAAFLLVCLWLLAARQEMLWLTVAIIFALLGSLVVPFRAIGRQRSAFDWKRRLMVQVPFGLFAGWISVAAFANVAAASKASGWTAAGGEPAWTLALLAMAGTLASVVAFRSRGEPAYVAAVLWALVAIAVADFQRGGGSAIAVLAIAAAVALLGAALGGARASANLGSHPPG